MFAQLSLRAICLAIPLSLLVLAAPVRADVDTTVLDGLDYDGLEWLEDTTNPGSWYAILSGDPSEPGPYLILNKVLKGNFTRPHLHPKPREIYVVEGTWWIGSGTTADPEASVGISEGNHVTNDANEVHWDGAKDEDVLLLIGGEGPAKTEFFN